MPYTLPTASDLKTRFPEFTGVADATVNAAIQDAARWVDTTWEVDDYQPAILYLAAHFLVTGQAVGAEGVYATENIKSERIGPISVTYGDGGSSGSGESNGMFYGTSYGRHWHAMARSNHPPILVIGLGL